MRKIIDAHVHIAPSYQLGDANVRPGIVFETHGRVVFPDGKREQFLPDILSDSSFTPETLVRVMDNAGVARALIIASSPRQIPDVIAAVSSWPSMFAGAMTIRLDGDCLESIELNSRLGLSAMKFEMSEGLGFTSPYMYPDFKFDSPVMLRVLEKAGNLGISITIDPGRIGGRGYQTEEFEKVTDMFPRTRFIVCHLGFPGIDMKKGSDAYGHWRRMTALARKDNVWFDVSALAVFYQDENYPFPSAVALVRRFMDEYGAHKAIWGSDIPGALCHATYRQLIDLCERSTLFTETEKDLLYYDNAVKAYFWPDE
jgi:predicted TIM-barrel fold metal-dependent hydrolase